MGSSRIIAALIIPVLLLLLLWMTIVFTRQQERRQRQRSGDLLLKVSLPRSRQTMLRAIGTVVIFAGLVLSVVWSYFDIQIRDVLSGFAGGSLGIGSVFWYSSFLHPELREKGVLIGTRLILWSRIRSYHRGGSDHLILQLRQRLGLSRQLQLFIQPLDQSAVEQVLQQKLNV